jgi:peptidase C39-like protein
VDRPTQENALSIYDSEYDMFGNWGRAVQRAGEMGLDAWIQRFRNWDQVKAMIAQGQPIVAGIKFKRGEFPSAVLSSTNGHLIVIRGFTRDGDVIVNDPANRKKGDGVIYKASELGNAWFANGGGVGYVIRKPPSMEQPKLAGRR